MKVLSLFDGISCGQLALDRAGISYEVYYSSEIDHDAIKVTQHHFPETVQLGDVQKLKGSDLPEIDLMIGGSPCQGFSFSGKGLNFEDPRSKLFFEFVRLLEEVRPKYFLLENVVMKKEWQDIISQHLGVEPVKLNSANVSAQNRVRLYWTNFPIKPLPDTGYPIQDIIGQGKYCAAMRGRRINPTKKSRSDYDRSIPIRQYIEPRANDKTNCLTTVEKDNVIIYEKLESRKLATDTEFRLLTAEEYEMLQTIPVGYTEVAGSSHQRKYLLGNAWTVDVIAHILKGIK